MNILKVVIPRYADLLGKTYLCIRLPDIFCNTTLDFRWIQGLGEHMIRRMYITIGGQIIDE